MGTIRKATWELAPGDEFWHKFKADWVVCTGTKLDADGDYSISYRYPGTGRHGRLLLQPINRQWTVKYGGQYGQD